MSKIQNSELDQYGGEPFEHRQFGIVVVEGVKHSLELCSMCHMSFVRRMTTCMMQVAMLYQFAGWLLSVLS